MAKREVKIRDDEEYITLNVLLKITGLIQTGGEAKWYLNENDNYTLRYNELQKRVQGVNSTMLTKCLRELEHDKMVQRKQ